jgi:hypothetical protein
LESIRAAGLRCAAVLLNEPDGTRDLAMATNCEVLKELCEVPILTESGKTQEASPERLDGLANS